jgi:hypothetical protein
MPTDGAVLADAKNARPVHRSRPIHRAVTDEPLIFGQIPASIGHPSDATSAILA